MRPWHEGFTPWPEQLAALYRAQGLWSGETLDGVLRRAAQRYGERTAVVCGARSVSYAELDARVEQLAVGLLERGLSDGARIVVQLPNCLEFIELCMACFRSGAIPVMALPGHRRSDLAHFIQQTDAIAYVHAGAVGPLGRSGFDYGELARALRPECPTLRLTIHVGEASGLESDGAVDFEALRSDARRAVPPVASSQVALLQLSGGSTGTPKLIPRTHDDYLYSVRQSVELCGLDAASVYLVALPISHNFPMSSAGFLGCMMAGGCSVLAGDPSPDAVFPLVAAHGVTHLAAVPPLARLWLQAAQSRGLQFPSLQVLQVGGAKLAPEVAAELRQGLGCALQQVFGMAEGLVCYTRLDDAPERVLGTQGRPMSPWDEVRVVDDDDRDVAAGQSGHLLTRGPYTVRGYYRAPEHNARAFTEDGFYRTGDIVRQTPAGDLVVVGRAKEQINRGGKKIAPVEVEQHLLAHPDVAEVAVVGTPDPVLGERISAFLVLKSGAQLQRPALRSYLLAAGLATFKLPDRYQFVEALPRTAVGKIDKKALAS